MSTLIGTIIAVSFDGASSQEPGFLPCDGTAVSRVTYASLFTAVGTNWGAGDGATTFNLPDYRGAFTRGVDNGAGIDPDAPGRHPIEPGGAAGDNVGSIEFYATALPPGGLLATSTAGDHNHSVSHLPNDSSWYQIAGSHYAQWNSSGTATSNDGLHSHTISAGGDSETRPVNVYVDYLVYAGV
jgi:microcystin-dependent protein